MSIGTSVLHKNSSKRELTVKFEIDFGAKRHELLTGGETITGTPAITILVCDAVSTDLVAGGIVVDSTNKKVQFTLTAAAAATVGKTYQVVCTVALTGGATIFETLDIKVEN